MSEETAPITTTELNIYSKISITLSLLSWFVLFIGVQSLGLAFSKASGPFVGNSDLMALLVIIFIIGGIISGVIALKKTTDKISKFLAWVGIIMSVIPVILIFILIFLGTGGFGLL